jgi:hypothetical protein
MWSTALRTVQRSRPLSVRPWPTHTDEDTLRSASPLGRAAARSPPSLRPTRLFGRSCHSHPRLRRRCRRSSCVSVSAGSSKAPPPGCARAPTAAAAPRAPSSRVVAAGPRGRRGSGAGELRPATTRRLPGTIPSLARLSTMMAVCTAQLLPAAFGGVRCWIYSPGIEPLTSVASCGRMRSAGGVDCKHRAALLTVSWRGVGIGEGVSYSYL